MNTLLLAAALLLLAAPAFADATRFVPPPVGSPLAPATYQPSRYAPYTRNTPRGAVPTIVPARSHASRHGPDRPSPYTRNYPSTTARNT